MQYLISTNCISLDRAPQALHAGTLADEILAAGAWFYEIMGGNLCTAITLTLTPTFTLQQAGLNETFYLRDQTRQ